MCLCCLATQLKAYEDDAVIAGYVLCQEGRRWNKMWYQVKSDCVLYKFKAHEVQDEKVHGQHFRRCAVLSQ